MTRAIPPVAVELIKKWEGLVDGDPNTPGLDPYICPTGYVTIGWGHVVRDPGDGHMLRGREELRLARQVFPDGISVEEAQALLDGDLVVFGEGVERIAGDGMSEGQFAALISFAFNIGLGALESSTLIRKLRAGDVYGAADELLRWNKGEDPRTKQKIVLPGLVKRREDERAVFLSDG